MTLNCEWVSEQLPDLHTGRLEPLREAEMRAHLASCSDCREELELVARVSRHRLDLPEGLESRILVAAGAGQEPRRRLNMLPPRRMALAASIAVALLGGAVVLNVSVDEFTVAQDALAPEQSGAGWIGVEAAFVSGASSLEDLTEEELETLLAELGS